MRNWSRLEGLLHDQEGHKRIFDERLLATTASLKKLAQLQAASRQRDSAWSVKQLLMGSERTRSSVQKLKATHANEQAAALAKGWHVTPACRIAVSSTLGGP
ncbi:hypothetical protein WJX81_007385 [Elliptochloris bilobata]|uniref:Uncharacterized protein n=1 Tax=Elliptochloris bilobata TaxID=381761 RepID=A0AAW1SD30_9CHLO